VLVLETLSAHDDNVPFVLKMLALFNRSANDDWTRHHASAWVVTSKTPPPSSL
jgi:hypothetical protein